MAQGKVYIYGKHALTEALRNAPGAVRKVFLSPEIHDQELKALIRKRGIAIAEFTPKNMPSDIESASHQGVIGLVSTENLVQPYEKFISELVVTPDTALVLLDELQDPQNVGAIIRSAAAFGISGVLLAPHNQAPITGSVVKVSAGMAFRVPLVQLGNVNTALADLKKRGFWIYGLAGEGDHPLTKEKFDVPAVFIFGNESTGIRAKTREHCDILLSISTHPRTESLNVAAAAAVTLYAWSNSHKKALQE